MKNIYLLSLIPFVIICGCNKYEPSDMQTSLKTAVTAAKNDSIKDEGNDAYLYKFRQNKRRAAAFLDSLKKSDPDLYDGLFFELYKNNEK